MFENVFSSSIIKRAQEKGRITVKFINPRDFAKDKRKTVDDTPYGGGAGMVLKPDILYDAINSIKPKPYIILLSASGKKYTQKRAKTLSKEKSIAIICGHYEGVDARIENFTNETLSLGDYVLTGGEIAAMALIDSVSRLVKGVISPNSPKEESFSQKLLEYPQYTKPKVFKGLKVPEILFSGDHKKIEGWRREQAIKVTSKNRPDLLNPKKD